MDRPYKPTRHPHHPLFLIYLEDRPDNIRSGVCKELPLEVTTDQEAIEIAQHMQAIKREEWVRGGCKGKAAVVEVVRVLWKGGTVHDEEEEEGNEKEKRKAAVSSGSM